MGKKTSSGFLRPGTAGRWFANISGKTGPVKIDFVLLVFAAFLTNFPYWNAFFMARGDSIYVFQPFYVFYNDFFFHTDLVRWFPYGSCGIPGAYWQYYYLTPFSYCAGILGWILRVENVLGLFKFSLLLEQLAMAWGIYKLCGELFRRRATVFFVCLGLVASPAWFLNPFWNFRIYYLLPLMLYFLILFFRRRQGHWLWLSMTVFCFSMLGSVIYFSILHAAVLLIFGFCLAVPDRFYLPWIFERSRRNLFAFLLMALTAAVFAYFAGHMFGHVKSLVYGRESGYLVSVNNFLNTGRGIHWYKFIELVFGGFQNSVTLYLGLLPLVFFLAAAGTQRSREFAAVCLTIVFLVLLSVGDKTPVARLAYFLFPPLRLFRYIGLIGGLIRFFLLIAAGFGLDRFLDRAGKGDETLKNRAWFLGCGFGFLVLVYFLVRQDLGQALRPAPWTYFFPLVLTVLVISLAILCWSAGRMNGKFLGMLAVGFFALDIMVYQQSMFKTLRPECYLMPDEVSRVHPYAFQHRRKKFAADMDGREHSRARAVEKFFGADRFFLFNNETYTFMQFDPSVGRYQVGIQMENTYDLLVKMSSWEMKLSMFGEVKTFNMTPSWQGVFAESQPKLRLYRNVAFVDDRLLSKLVSRPDIDISRILLLNKTADHSPESRLTPQPAAPPGSIHVRSFVFNRLVLDVNVFLKDPVWLYYADAWHPGWRAYVDGQRQAIAKAYGAFKAVKVGPGRHEVRFEFFDGLESAAGIAIAVMATLFGAIMLLAVIAECFCRARGRSAV